MNGKASDRRVAIIGCGYVGCALGEALVRAGHKVVGTTTSRRRVDEIDAVNTRLRTSGANLRPERKRGTAQPRACAGGSDDSAAIRQDDVGLTPIVLEHVETDRLHALLLDRDTVYLTLGAGRQRRDYRKVYLDGAKNLLVALRGTPVKRIIYTSSTQVYGQDDGGWVDESSPPKSRSENGRILIATEQALLDGVRGEQAGNLADICVTVLRLGGIHGPGRDLAERIRDSAGRERSDGDAYVNLIHRDDIITALVTLLDVPFAGVLNLTDGTPVERRKLYDGVIAAAGRPSIRWLQPHSPPGTGKRVKNDLAKKTLDLTIAHPAAAYARSRFSI